MMIKKVLTVAIVCGFAVMAQTSTAADADGRTIGVTCNGCHGTDGASKGAAPPLRGVDAAYLVNAMKDFKSGKRPSTIMDRIAKGYSDQEFMNVGKHFSGLK